MRILIAAGVALALIQCCFAQTMTATHLRCEYLINPIGIGETKPRLSWWNESKERGAVQTAYEILASSSREKLSQNVGDLWDTGKVSSDKSIQIEYAGSPLKSRDLVFWKVRVWDKSGNPSPYSEVAKWEIGLLDPSDWQANWIGKPNATIDKADPSPYIRKGFDVSSPIDHARIYVSAQGLYELYLNGHRVSDDHFNPGFTDYKFRIQYETYDVTRLIKQGRNAVGAILGDGWYVGHVGGWGRQQYGKQPMGLVQLEVTFKDGSQMSVGSSSAWKVADGPILSSDFMKGEDYDARKELGNWSAADFDDSSWQSAMQGSAPAAAIVAQCSEPVRKWQELHAKSITQPKTGMYVVDLGQNMVGWARMKVKGKASDKVQLRFAEMLNPDGTIYTANLRSATSTDTYILKGDGEEVFEPHFTFHGFRYVEVTGYPGLLQDDSITGIVLGSATPDTGKFECSNQMVNQLWHNIYWGQRGNYLSVPTDCPQRDERLGWMGDAEVFVRTAAYNCEIGGFMTKWLNDVQDGQTPSGAFADVSPRVHDFGDNPAAPGWGDAGVIVPYAIYQAYDDKRILERHFESMRIWVDYIHDNNPNLLWEKSRANDYGDWLNIHEETPHEVLGTAFFAHSTDLVAKSADVLGLTDEAAKYHELFKGICDAFNKAYVGPDGRIKGDTQTAYLVALGFHMLPDDMRPLAIQHLVEDVTVKRNNHLATGFLGVSLLNPVLTETGNLDLAYKLLLQDTFPSWGYPIKNGATTIWERWDGWTQDKGFQDPGMNSFNHYSLGSVGEWLYGVVGGIKPGTPGYKEIVIHPQPGGNLTYANTSYQSIYGDIKSNWKIDGHSFELSVKIPANTKALVYVPAASAEAVMEHGHPASSADGLKFLRMEDGAAVFEAGSGSYDLTSTK
ncbi:MAG TPA: glycoside hydrolase family 78 protein [Fimbriimonadaceae bacterium]